MAVFVISNIADQGQASLDLVSVSPVGAPSFPSHATMLQTVKDTYHGSYWFHYQEAGPFHLFVDPPTDYGHFAIVDRRDGAIVFAAWMEWFGGAGVMVPLSSSHTFALDPELLAGAPESSTVLHPLDWNDPYESTWYARALDIARSTDVVRSLDACGDYRGVTLLLNSQVSLTDPAYLSGIVVLTGQIGMPWAEGMVATESVTHGSLKARYR